MGPKGARNSGGDGGIHGELRADDTYPAEDSYCEGEFKGENVSYPGNIEDNGGSDMR